MRRQKIKIKEVKSSQQVLDDLFGLPTWAWTCRTVQLQLKQDRHGPPFPVRLDFHFSEPCSIAFQLPASSEMPP